MPSERSVALMRYTLISANVLIIILVSLAMVRGLLHIKNKNHLESFSTRNISSINTTLSTTSSAKSIALIIDSVLRYSNALLGLWAGIKYSFTLFIAYGIVLVVSLVLGITIGLGADQYGTVIPLEDYSLGVFHIFGGIFLALLAFRLACLTRSGTETDIEADNGSEFQEEQQNQCEIV